MKTRIIIVDRHEDDAKALTAILAKDDYRDSETCKNAADAIELCLTNRFDMAFIATDLRDKDGFETCHELLKPLPMMYVVLIKTPYTERDIFLAKNSGAQGMLEKPFSKGAILSTMNKFELFRRMPKHQES